MRALWQTITMAGLALAGPGSPARAEDEPVHLQGALDALRSAERQLEKSSPDDAGHRARALALTKDAIDHLERAVVRRR